MSEQAGMPGELALHTRLDQNGILNPMPDENQAKQFCLTEKDRIDMREGERICVR
jgi:hypothetical protein